MTALSIQQTLDFFKWPPSHTVLFFIFVGFKPNNKMCVCEIGRGSKIKNQIFNFNFLNIILPLPKLKQIQWESIVCLLFFFYIFILEKHKIVSKNEIWFFEPPQIQLIYWFNHSQKFWSEIESKKKIKLYKIRRMRIRVLALFSFIN